MSIDEIQKKHDRLVDKVRQMRGIQKEYFKYRIRSDLDRARRLEREVDQLLAEEVNTLKSKQIDLL